MEIVLISPKCRKLESRFSPKGKAFTGPFTLATVAASIPEGIKVRIFDENADKLDWVHFREQSNSDVLAGITATTPGVLRAYEISEELRRTGVKTILGGPHATLMPEEAINHADSVVIGEVEGLWQEIISDFQNEELKPFYKREELPSPMEFPPSADYLVPSSIYALPPNQMIQWGRGCPHGCTFCSVSRIFGANLRHRPVEAIIEEIKRKKRDSAVFFVDDNIVGMPRKAKELFRALIPLQLKWSGQSSVNIARDDELLALASESGCTCLLIGFESISPSSLKEMRKQWSKSEEYKELIDKIHDKHIQIIGCFVLGFDSDTRGIFSETAEFVEKTKIDIPQITLLTPFPGTQLYEKLKAEGRIIEESWDEYTVFGITFIPKNMTVEQLAEGYDMVCRRLYSYRSIIKRTIRTILRDRSIHLALYTTLAANLAYRKLTEARYG